MYSKTTSKKLSLALFALTFLSACKQPTRSSALHRKSAIKLASGSIVGALGATATVSTMATAHCLLCAVGAACICLPVLLITVPISVVLITQGVKEHREAKILAQHEHLAALPELEPISPKE